MADSPLKILTQAIKQSQPGLARKNWREALRDHTGQDGGRLWQKLIDLSEGKPIFFQLPDGRTSLPVIPTPDVQLRATVALAEMGFGRAVLQTEIVKAEQEAKDFESVRALSEEELDRQIALLEGKTVPRFTEGTEDAQVEELDLWSQIYYSRWREEQREE